MTFLEVKERHQLSPRVRALSPEEADLLEAHKIMAAAAERNRRAKEELERSLVTCTTCDKTAKYTRQAGWMQGVYHIFTCPDGHESPYRLRGGKLVVYQWLIDQNKET